MRLIPLLVLGLLLIGSEASSQTQSLSNNTPPLSDDTPCGEIIANNEVSLFNPSSTDLSLRLWDTNGNEMTPMDSDGNTISSPVVIPQGDFGCSLFLSFNSSRGGEPPYFTPIVFYDPDITSGYTMEVIMPNKSSYLYFNNLKGFPGACDTGEESFLCPNPNQGVGFGDYHVEVNTSDIRVSPNIMWASANSGHNYVDENIAGDDWVWPYHADLICAGGKCNSDATDWRIQSPYVIMPTDGIVVTGTPLVKRISEPITLPASGVYDWTEDWLTLAFGSSVNFDIESQDFAATNMTFTASGASGWGGVTFASGASGTLTGGTIENVGGWGSYAVDIKNGATRVEINGTTIQNAIVPSYVSGIRVSGDAHDVDIAGETVSVKGATVRRMTGDGIVLASRAEARFSDNLIEINDGDGLLAGFHTEAFFGRDRASTSTTEAANQSRLNGGYGAYATASGSIVTGFYYYPAYYPNTTGYYTEYPEGYNVIFDNDEGGIHAANSGGFSAGSDVGQGELAYNSLSENGTASSQWYDGFGPDASTAGTNTSGYARNDWWGRAFAPDATSSVAVYPLLTSNPISSNKQSPSGARAAASESGEGEVNPLRAAYVAAVEQKDAAALSAIVELAPGAPEAAQALHQLGYLVGRGLASEADVPLAMAALRAEANGRRSDHRAWALAALVQAHDLRGERSDALAAATALVDEGGETEVYGRIARAHLLHDLGDTRGAEADAAAVTRLAPDSREARLVLEALGLSAQDGAQGLQAEMAGKSAMQEEPTHSLGAPYPNPSQGGVRIPFSLSDDGTVSLSVYDALGREVSVLARGAYDAGRHSARLRSGLAPGVYLVRLRVDGQAPQVERFTVTR